MNPREDHDLVRSHIDRIKELSQEVLPECDYKQLAIDLNSGCLGVARSRLRIFLQKYSVVHLSTIESEWPPLSAPNFAHMMRRTLARYHKLYTACALFDEIIDAHGNILGLEQHYALAKTPAG